MTKRNQVFKCEKCGMIVEVLFGGAGSLVCCGQPMDLLAENTVDAAVEKHVPVVAKKEGGLQVVVGDVRHPMVEKHWIAWIELLADGNVYRSNLEPGDAPEAFFRVDVEHGVVRAFCNLHGHWQTEF